MEDYTGVIPGLCPKKDSCAQCRAARIADPGYQAWLKVKSAKWWAAERKRTMENAISCNHERQLGFRGHVNAVNQFAAMHNSPMGDYQKYKGGD